MAPVDPTTASAVAVTPPPAGALNVTVVKVCEYPEPPLVRTSSVTPPERFAVAVAPEPERLASRIVTAGATV